jgi:GDSL-like Lipase/Acylhydrolase family
MDSSGAPEGVALDRSPNPGHGWNSLTQYHPRIGYTMMPSVKSRVPHESGGYLVRTNAAGFRSDREFVKPRTPGKFRALLFGDSMTAGDGVSNARRYSDVVESLVPNLEVFNYALSGTGTDQHYLAYLECADVEHDLVIIGINAANILRVASRFKPYTNDQGREFIYAKPYYSLEKEELLLHQVPVPKAPLTAATISAEDGQYVDWGSPNATLRSMVKKIGMRDIMQKITRFQPAPGYESATNANWLLLRKILEAWIRGSNTPVLLLLVPQSQFIEETSDPTDYQARYRELANDTGCHLHDPLPDLWQYSSKDRRAFRFKVDPHFTPKGHQALAASLAPAIERIMAATKQ